MKINKSGSKIILMAVISILVILTFAASSFAGAVNSPPQFLPSFPMMAGDNVMIMWVPVPGAVKYKVYQNGKQIGEALPGMPFQIPAPKEPGVYQYTVTGVDPAGEEGPPSTPGELSIVLLEQPKGISDTFLGGIANIRWEASPNAVIYDVYKSETRDGEYKLIASVTEDRYVDSEVKSEGNEGKSFFYKIISKDRFNKTSPDTEVYELKVPEKVAEKKKLPDVTLKIFRSKRAGFLKPMGGESGYEIKSSYDAKLLSDGQSMIFTDASSGKIVVIDKYGDVTRFIGSRGVKPGQFSAPFKLYIDEDDNVYLTDFVKPKLMAYDQAGKVLFEVDGHPVNEMEIVVDKSKMRTSTKLSCIVSYNGKLYIADKASGLIHIYNKDDGTFEGYFRNKETGKVIGVGMVTEILLTADERLILGRTLEKKVTVYNIEAGELIFEIGESKSFVGAFASVGGLAVDKNGNIIASDGIMHTIQYFSKEDGTYMYHMGDDKAIPDPRVNDQRPYAKDISYPAMVNVDNQGRVIFYSGGMRAFIIRELVGDKPWDITVDSPEGTLPPELLKQ